MREELNGIQVQGSDVFQDGSPESQSEAAVFRAAGLTWGWAGATATCTL